MSGASLSAAERKRLLDQKRSRTRINIGEYFQEWRSIMEERGFANDRIMCKYLLDMYKHMHHQHNNIVNDTQTQPTLPCKTNTEAALSYMGNSNDHRLTCIETLSDLPTDFTLGKTNKRKILHSTRGRKPSFKSKSAKNRSKRTKLDSSLDSRTTPCVPDDYNNKEEQHRDNVSMHAIEFESDHNMQISLNTDETELIKLSYDLPLDEEYRKRFILPTTLDSSQVKNHQDESSDNISAMSEEGEENITRESNKTVLEDNETIESKTEIPQDTLEIKVMEEYPHT